MKKENWIWMPHAAHLIVGDKCQFHLATYVGKYLILTVGEYWPGQKSREINAEITDPEWQTRNQHLKGDDYDNAYFQKFGYEEIGYKRKYETMVFKAIKAKEKCCPYTAKCFEDIDFIGSNTAEEAYKNHIKLCKKWSKK